MCCAWRSRRCCATAFFQYNYGPGYAFAAVFEAATLSPDLNFTAGLEPYLEEYLAPGGYAYNVTHGIAMPYTGAVGEPTSFAVAYLARARSATDVAVATGTADTYMLRYPYRLPDGTFVRPDGWAQEPGHSFLCTYKYTGCATAPSHLSPLTFTNSVISTPLQTPGHLNAQGHVSARRTAPHPPARA
jgi:hypothetical protein